VGGLADRRIDAIALDDLEIDPQPIDLDALRPEIPWPAVGLGLGVGEAVTTGGKLATRVGADDTSGRPDATEGCDDEPSGPAPPPPRAIDSPAATRTMTEITARVTSDRRPRDAQLEMPDAPYVRRRRRRPDGAVIRGAYREPVPNVETRPGWGAFPAIWRCRTRTISEG